MDESFTHIGLKRGTKKKIAILSRVIGPRIYELVAIWVNDAWEMAKKAGMVTDAMLEETPAQGFMSIKSPSKRMEMEVGWQMAAGTALGWERGIQRLMPTSLSGITAYAAPSFAGLDSVSTETARGGVQIVVPIEYKPFVSTADEREARTRLAPIIIDVIREYLNR